MLKYISLFFSVTLLLYSCRGNGGSGNIIPHNEMTDLLLDMHLIDGSIYSSISQNPDTLYKYDMDRFVVLFKHYHVDSVQFRKSFKYYTLRPVELSAMYAAIMARLQKKIDSLNTSMLKQPPIKRPNG
jgi:hypothetical protein